MIREINRIRQVYQERQQRDADSRYSFFQPGHLYTIQQLERGILELLKLNRMTALGEFRILDVGCGGGSLLASFVRYGAYPENLCGVDLTVESMAAARAVYPNIEFMAAEGGHLPFADRTFDLVTQFTVFTSILDQDLRRRVAAEMLRVLRPNGAVIWYDFILNPTNPDVRGIGRREIERLFPDCRFSWRRATLAPPLARRLARFSWLACLLLEKIPPLRTHYLVLITRRSDDDNRR